MVEIVIYATREESANFDPANHLKPDARFPSSKVQKAAYSKVAHLIFSTTQCYVLYKN